MVTVPVYTLCIGGFVVMWVGAFFGWLILGLCNAAAEGERQAEQIRRAMRG